ncbi:MAG: type VI secretion system secreted protein VgrG [Sulfitobacter sp.]|jgi:type VI secretion system secreted protein VgrG
MATQFNSAFTLKGQKNPKDVTVLATAIEGGISSVPVAYVEFLSKDKALDLGDVVGTEAGIVMSGEKGTSQRFWGTCISAEAKGVVDGWGRYVIELRPWLWFLTRSRNNRIFQQMKTTAIIQDILGDYGFSGELVVKHSNTDKEREYCTQYRETDYDFIVRLLEEEGFYFYFDHKDNAVKLVIANEVSTHEAASSDDKVPYRELQGGGRIEHLGQWNLVERVVTGKVTLRDYDFEKPSADLTSSSSVASGSHGHKAYETYEYPGGFSDVAKGDSKAASLIEADAAAHKTWRAQGNVLHLSPGKLFELADHPRHTSPATSVFMVTKIKQFFRADTDENKYGETVLQALHAPGIVALENVLMTCEAVLKSKPFRMPATTPRPEISGVQTAKVTGPEGAEITVDKYGRIRVQFHWDRSGKKDDKSSCWVRTMMPWTGKNWGMVSWPRVGQEVVIQFEEGNPDRPLCVGMLYNADTMPPYEMPANATRSGIKTNSSKGGSGYNELMFEDKKGDELVRIGAEKDFIQTVQNAAHVRVGYIHEKDAKAASAQGERSMKLEVENHLDEIVEKGDHSFTVKTGSQDVKVKKDKSEEIEGKSTLTVTGNVTEVIKTGNYKQTVKSGNITREVSMGNEAATVKLGNFSVDAKAGKIDLTAMQSITLKVGPSSIKIDMSGITIKGPMVKIDGSAMVEVKGAVTQVKGSATLILKGGVTLIN